MAGAAFGPRLGRSNTTSDRRPPVLKLGFGAVALCVGLTSCRSYLNFYVASIALIFTVLFVSGLALQPSQRTMRWMFPWVLFLHTTLYFGVELYNDNKTELLRLFASDENSTAADDSQAAWYAVKLPDNAKVKDVSVVIVMTVLVLMMFRIKYLGIAEEVHVQERKDFTEKASISVQLHRITGTASRRSLSWTPVLHRTLITLGMQEKNILTLQNALQKPRLLGALGDDPTQLRVSDL
jgi:hypothetical protein